MNRNIAFFAIKRPIFIASIAILLFVLGFITLKSMGVDLFPNAEKPTIQIQIMYPGASPEEVENLVTKPVEDEIASLGGLSSLQSQNIEGISIIIATFTEDTDFKYAEQQIRDRMAVARPKLPSEAGDPVYRKFDMASIPILRYSLEADLSPTKLYDVADEEIKTRLEQVQNVGAVLITGGQKREVQVELDRDKLNSFRISATQVVNQLKAAGVNVPAGKHEIGVKETMFRTVGEFESLGQIGDSVIVFSGDVSNSVSVKDLGRVVDGAEDPTTLGLLYNPYRTETETVKTLFGKKQVSREVKIENAESRPALFLDIYRQSGTNTVEVADGVKARVEKINTDIKSHDGAPRLVMISDYSKIVRANVDDVKTTIFLGIILAVVVVYLFIGSVRSTIIAGLAIPISLFGAFILMWAIGFSLNLMSLMGLSLVVGLLIDDAIVIQENIYRKIEHGLHPFKAAVLGTQEVKLAVIATTLTIFSVFGPIGFLPGTTGIFFRQFGFTVVFAMGISLLTALTIAPLLNAYFTTKSTSGDNWVINKFNKLQDRIDVFYERVIDYTLQNKIKVLLLTFFVFILSAVLAKNFVPSSFQPDSDYGEFGLSIELPSDTSLEGTKNVVAQMEKKIRPINGLKFYTVAIGNEQAETNKASFSFVCLPKNERDTDTNGMKQRVREAVKEFAFANPAVGDAQMGGNSAKKININVSGNNLTELDAYANHIIAVMSKIKGVTELSTSSKPGKPELQVLLDPLKMEMLGVQPRSVGSELRTFVEGTTVAKLHDGGYEYDIRVRLRNDQRNLRAGFPLLRVPNTQNKLIPLSAISRPVDITGPSVIIRQDKSRIIQVTANLLPGFALGDMSKLIADTIAKEAPKPKGIDYKFVGQSEDFAKLMKNILIAFFLSILLIYLVLSSLYDSFITPMTIMTALPPALTGAFIALLVSRKSFDMFSMIGTITLLGLVTKNSILLVDFALEGIRAGMTRSAAIKRAGIIRLRPILMTSFAIIAGTLPLALGLGEAASYRQGMGIAIIGGVFFSTIITLVVVPAIFEYVEVFRSFIERRLLKKDIIKAAFEMNSEDARVLVDDDSNDTSKSRRSKPIEKAKRKK